MERCPQCRQVPDPPGLPFCPDCGHPLGATSLVSVEVNDNRPFVAGGVGVLEFRLSNGSIAPVDRLTLSIGCPLLSHSQVFRGKLDPRQSAVYMSNMLLDRFGQISIELGLAFVCEQRTHAFSAQPVINVLARPRGPNVLIHDRSIRAETGAKIGFGFHLVEGGLSKQADYEVTDVNALLRGNSAPRWALVALIEDARMREQFLARGDERELGEGPIRQRMRSRSICRQNEIDISDDGPDPFPGDRQGACDEG